MRASADAAATGPLRQRAQCRCRKDPFRHISTRTARGRPHEMPTRPKTRRNARAYAVLTSVALVVGLLTVGHASAAPAFHAAGSVNQVYVTGAAPNESMSLLNSSGQDGPDAATPTRSAACCSATSRPRKGYRVRRASDGTKSAALTVHAERRRAVEPGGLQPVDPDQRLRVPHDARRHEARVHGAPADAARRASPASRPARSCPAAPTTCRRTRR